METRKKIWDFPSIARQVMAGLVADPLAKVICLILAVMLWMYIVGAAEVHYEFGEVPVEYVNVAPGLAVSEDSLRAITVRVSGPKASISALESSDFKVVKSLADKREGEKWVVLSLEDVRSPQPDVRIERTDPISLRVFLERVESRLVRVVPKLQGESPLGFIVTARARPEQVMVTGPYTLVHQLTEVPTEVVDISGRQATFAATVRLRVEMKSVQKLNPASVEVLVEIAENIVEKITPNVRVELQSPIPGQTVQIKPEQVSIHLRGPQAILDRIDPTQMRVMVELPPGKQFHLAVPRVTNLPARVDAVSYDPALVRVSIPGQ